MAVYSHGGGCCGIRHSSGYSLGNDKNRIYKKIRQDKRFLANGMLLEVVLADYQLREQPNLGPALLAEGFVPVTSFRNPNSRRVVTVFHYTAEPRPIPESKADKPNYEIRRDPSWRRVRPEDFLAPRRPLRLRLGFGHPQRYLLPNAFHYYGKGMSSKFIYYGGAKIKWEGVEIEVQQ